MASKTLASFHAALALPGLISAAPLITDVQIAPSTVTLFLVDDGSSNQFEVHRNPSLNPINWSKDPSVALESLGGNRYKFTLSRTAADREFYRVVGSFLGTGPDPDGDGLPTVLEAVIGTSGTDSDTDDDGFSDGVEYAVGTNPNDRGDFPDRVDLPMIEFESTLSEATEGGPPHVINLVISPPYSGSVYYAINPRSSAVEGEDFAGLSGTLLVSGSTASITLQITDDLEISPERLLLLDLSTDPPGGGYRAGGRVTHVVRLSENDCYWSGALTDNLGQRNFRLRVQQDSATRQIAFVSGASDGLPTPDEGVSSQSTGLIPAVNLEGDPQEVFPATLASFTPDLFSATSPEFLAETNGYLGPIPMKRQLSFLASPLSIPSHRITEATILGSFTETLSHATDLESGYLTTTVNGQFVLMKEIPAGLDLPSAFVSE